MTISSAEMQSVLYELFLKYGFSETRAKILADTHTENTLMGVNSHGVNRVPAFINLVRKGIIKINEEAEPVDAFGSIERWDGRYGSGVINARKCTDRAIELAKAHGMGLVALRNTNHWMRGGAYGWQAADAGCIAILFTNTQPNMPPWGGRDSRIGNNPFIVAIPRAEGHVVLDMAISQFSFGKIQEYALKDEKLPFAGGWDENNELSDDPVELRKKQRGLPIGYWKGSALSMILDMLATLLSAGDSTYKISQKEEETGVSQIYLCIDPGKFSDPNISEKLLNEIIDYTHDVPPMNSGDKVYYPGERALMNRERNLANGMIVDDKIWREVMELVNQ
ncbi:3-dehydro-L-gulonate 2-dehydrogenase [Marinoscillum pacificum]|uniref:3-dehydro-L-gulonate 2-dehydrogenase n=1 Tax=Marinoscillum pacificum TaxID=392723 RepID=UPI00215706B4|nr:3-dehydro-L-gulonate 2-dehydrogenase [Marinoscillum pacificum]